MKWGKVYTNDNGKPIDHHPSIVYATDHMIVMTDSVFKSTFYEFEWHGYPTNLDVDGHTICVVYENEAIAKQFCDYVERNYTFHDDSFDIYDFAHWFKNRAQHPCYVGAIAVIEKTLIWKLENTDE